MAIAVATKRIPLDRRVCVIRPQSIDIRPALGAVYFPAVGLLASVGSFIVIAFLRDELAVGLLAALLIPGVVIAPLSAMGLFYSLFGTHVIVDNNKKSACFQQGVLGLGLGTVELVPFWKVDHIVVEEAGMGEAEVRGLPPAVELRAFAVVLVKASGKRLLLGEVITPNEDDLVAEGFGRAMEVAEAVGELVEKPVKVTVEMEEEPI